MADNITLRDLRAEDLDTFFEFGRDLEAVAMAAFTPEDPDDREAFDAHWSKIRQNPSVRIRTVLAGDVVAGHLASFDLEGQRELTYWIGRAFWGRGVATEALRQFVDEEAPRPLFGRIAFDNAGSRRVLEKCGFVQSGEGMWHSHARGGEIREFIFRLD